MIPSLICYSGFTVAAAGVFLALKPTRRLGVTKRSRGLAIAGAGAAIAGAGLLLPVRESRSSRVQTRLDEFAPAWQFREFHRLRVAATPERVYEAIGQVRADEIFLFRTLTWIRRGGRALPPGVLNAGTRESLLDVATNNGFVRLADDPPRELVIGTVVIAPPGPREPLSPQALSESAASRLRVGRDELCCGARWAGPFRGFNRDASVRQQPLGPPRLRQILAGYLSRQRADPPHVVARNRRLGVHRGEPVMLAPGQHHLFAVGK